MRCSSYYYLIIAMYSDPSPNVVVGVGGSDSGGLRQLLVGKIGSVTADPDGFLWLKIHNCAFRACFRS